MTDYYLRYMNFAGNLIATIDNFVLLDYGRSKNEIGVMDLQVPASAFPGLPIIDGRLEVYRRVGAGAYYLDSNTQWFIRDFFYSGYPNNPTLNIQAYDLVNYISRRYVEYPADTAETSKTDYIDDMMKEILDENAGAGAIAARDISAYLQIQGDLSLAPSVTKAFSWRPILRLFQELCEASLENGTWLAFDVVKVSDTVSEFRTYVNQRGVDLTGIVTVSPENGALSDDTTLSYRYSEEVTEVTVAGRGEGIDRAVVSVTDAVRVARSPINRIELFQDARQTDLAASLTTEAEEALRAGRPKIILEGTLVETPNIQFGIHYNYGDIITGLYRGIAIPVHVDSYGVRVMNGEEQLTVRVRGEIDA